MDKKYWWLLLVGAAMLLYKGGATVWLKNDKGKQYQVPFDAAEKRYGLPAGLLKRMAYQESRYDARAVNARSGARGLMQFMPATAASMNFDPLDPVMSIDRAGFYIKNLYKQFGSWRLALAAYNWGPGNVQKKGIALAPAETQQYYSAIMVDVGLT